MKGSELRQLVRRTAVMAFISLAGTTISAWAYAFDPIWQWEHPRSGGFYSGQQSLADDTGLGAYNRTPNLLGAMNTVNQPPILLSSVGTDVLFSVEESGSWLVKRSCGLDETLQVFVSPVTACDSGYSNDIQGIHVDAIDGAGPNAGKFKPLLRVYTSGAWRDVTDPACGRLEVKQLCKDNAPTP